jgi:hypothetical protein
MNRRIQVPDGLAEQVSLYVEQNCSDGSACGQFVPGGTTYFLPASLDDYVLVKMKFSDKSWNFDA